jgi:hypothetical protein
MLLSEHFLPVLPSPHSVDPNPDYALASLGELWLGSTKDGDTRSPDTALLEGSQETQGGSQGWKTLLKVNVDPRLSQSA